MIRRIVPLVIVLVVASQALAQPGGRQGRRGGGGQGARGVSTDAYYRLGPDSLPQEGVPKGEITDLVSIPSEAYPGTFHGVRVYVPAQYDPETPTSLMVFQDGHAYLDPNGDVRAQNVLDNLIFRRELPVMIAMFVNPGRTPEQPEPPEGGWGDQTTNRPTEYNSLDDRYAQVVVDELLPWLKERYNISDDPERHGIGGASSGAIAAFTVAWHRPDQFRKVLSIVGSFVDLRGGNAYPDIVLESDPKPLRVFLQDGRNDNRARGAGGGGRGFRRGGPGRDGRAGAGRGRAGRGAADADQAGDAQPGGRGGRAGRGQARGAGRGQDRGARRGGGRGNSDPTARDWFYQNVRLANALEEKGYDVNYVWGIGQHGQKQGGAIFPDMMRWLWRDQPVSTDPADMEERSYRNVPEPPAVDETAE